jgi:hypothetical protein
VVLAASRSACVSALSDNRRDSRRGQRRQQERSGRTDGGQAGIGKDRIIVLVRDGAGWHTAPLAMPDAIRLVYPALFARTSAGRNPLAQVDEPLANSHFDNLEELDAVLVMRCALLSPTTAISLEARPGFNGGPSEPCRFRAHPDEFASYPAAAKEFLRSPCVKMSTMRPMVFETPSWGLSAALRRSAWRCASIC